MEHDLLLCGERIEFSAKTVKVTVDDGKEDRSAKEVKAEKVEKPVAPKAEKPIEAPKAKKTEEAN